MNNQVYICSTLRHLLFSLSKASNEKNVRSIILFFFDYQNIEIDTLRQNNIPKNIQLITLSRNELKEKLTRTILGKAILVVSLRNFSLLPFFRKIIFNKINSLHPNINLRNDGVRLFVFNERNKMSRLFRLLVNDYEMIEDGVGNYYRIPVKGYKKLVRSLTGKPSNYWVFGEDNRCKKIHAVYPENLPIEVRDKGQKIDFLENNDALSVINSVFKFSDNIEQLNVIIATQPPSKAHQSHYQDPNFQIQTYQYMLDFCQSKGLKVAFKLHPSESLSKYQSYYPNETYLPVKQPLELVVLNCATTPNILSINSTAGLGFESFCNRLSLIEDKDTSRFGDIMLNWEKEPELLKKRIEELLS